MTHTAYLKDLVDKPLEELACQTDSFGYHASISITKDHSNFDFWSKQLDLVPTEHFEGYNGTSLGTIACFIVRSPEPILREKAQTLLDTYKEWFYSKN